MNFIIFNNTIVLSDGKKARVLERNSNSNAALSSIDSASVCVVDVDVIVASAIEVPVKRKTASWSASFRSFTKMSPMLSRMSGLIIISFR